MATEARRAAAPPHRPGLELDDLRRMLPRPRVERLAGGLTLCVIEDPRVPLVATAVVYRAGARDEEPGLGGTAHFLEHMMFKGSERFGAGEIDRLTRALGGSNNAFTSHDSTLYYFTFAADRWHHALDVEADRMAGLTLDEAEVASERQVILEEIAMYEGEPWDALDREVTAAFFAPHPYGRPVLGTRAELEAIGGGVLRDFHRRFYRPSNAVLVVAGDVGPEVEEKVERTFRGVDGDPASVDRGPAAAPARRRSGPRRAASTRAVPGRVERHRVKRHRVKRRQGEVPRMLLALPAPDAGHPDHPALMLLAAVLGSGRSSRLHRALVDEGQLCVWVSADVQETVDPGALTVALEVVPGVEPARVEDEVLRQLEALRRGGPTAAEVARAQRIVTADWVFGHERVFQQAFLAGTALALFDLEHPWRYFERLLAAGADRLGAVAERTLRPAEGVLGWSLPRERG